MEPFRVEPQMPVQAYKTYALRQRPDTQVKVACEEVQCEAWQFGWIAVIDESTELGQAQALYIRTQAGRTFKEQKRGDGMTVFTFEAKQRCFAEHFTQPQIHLVRRGDWRANLGLIRRHTRGIDWMEDAQEHFESLKNEREEG